MEYTTLLTELKDGILTVTLNRPDKLNALNIKLVEEVEMVMERIYDDPEILCAVFTGSGDKAFAAGADISEIAEINAIHGRKFAERGQEVFAEIENCHKPVIAAVNGFALGGGCELAMACHFRIASENARFGQPEVKLGIIPGYGGTQRLTALIGRGRAIELMTTCDMIDAAEALRIGLVNHVVPQDELLPKCREILGKIMKQGPIAVAQVIHSVNAYGGAEGYRVEANAFGSCCRTEDFKEGTTAFLEKRKPAFQGK